MKHPLLTISAFACLALGADQPVRPELLQVKTVYMLPMRYGLDQYLANELVRSGAVRVVLDPAKADAVFTDKLGDAVEQKLNALYPPPAKEVPKPAAADENKPATAAASDTTATPGSVPDAGTKPTNSRSSRKGGGAPDSSYFSIYDAADGSNSRPQGSVSSGRGNVFLIDRNTRSVIWSYYEPPRSGQPGDLKHTADHVASAFKHAIQPKAEHP
jgi:hypothetical protein